MIFNFKSKYEIMLKLNMIFRAKIKYDIPC